MPAASDSASAERKDPGGEPLPRYEVRKLTRGGVAAELEHDGAVYTLRITRQNKVILTK